MSTIAELLERKRLKMAPPKKKGIFLIPKRNKKWRNLQFGSKVNVEKA